ncbi:unnamed protein product [Rodentolepis nana]|uniref:Ricin B-type lectin domain-containing protein n=1 Tax=Rodentolepis nana TaxID=102285 RepID=A0A0R3T481_RODNA|nr:unnamed protein product [Rodentolepis nana]
MPTARRACAAINIPNVGILVVGGSKKISLDSEGLSTCELLIKKGIDWKWEQYTSMQHSRVFARGVYHNERAYVISLNDFSVDMLTIQPGAHGQWTLIPVRNSPQDEYLWSMAVSEDQVMLSTRDGNIYRMELKEPEARNPNAVEWVNTVAIIDFQQPTILALK